MPRFGLGTCHMTNSETMKKAVTEKSYRMYDCASFYKNEEVVGEALDALFNKEKAVAREDMFIISKCWINEVEDVAAACQRSLKKLGVDYIDLYLVHWPVGVMDKQVDG